VNLVVPDASVILKWVLPERIAPDRENALALRRAAESGAVELLVPALWRFEVGNTLGRLLPNRAVELIGLCEACGLRESKLTREWLHETMGLVVRYSVSFYDASYHALALVHGGEFVTADLSYIRKAAGVGQVQALASWKSDGKSAR